VNPRFMVDLNGDGRADIVGFRIRGLTSRIMTETAVSDLHPYSSLVLDPRLRYDALPISMVDMVLYVASFSISFLLSFFTELRY